MYTIFKKTKFFIGIVLLVQAFTFLILFLLLYSKKKSIAKTLLTLSAAGGITGAALMLKGAAELKSDPRFSVMDAFCDCSDDSKSESTDDELVF